LWASASFSRRRPTDAAWPSKAAWQKLNDAVGRNLIPVNFPIADWKSNPDGVAAKELLANIKNPYYVGEQPGLTETLGWLDAWTTQPSVYAVAARNANDIAAAVNFARDNQLRLVVKGGGHSYQGTSNARDSLLIWTRRMNDIETHEAFVPQGCAGTVAPQPAVTVGAGTIGAQAYDAVTTRHGKYVQGGGCLTVGLAGLVQGGGFGSFSKHYGSAASSLLEAEVVTADGQIRIANACTNSDLFWALKGGGGGTFGVISKMTLRVHDLPENFGTANFAIKASSDDAYRRLIRRFVTFYRDSLFNDHWGEQAHFRPDNVFEIQMLAHGLDADQVKATWKPFLDWVAQLSSDYSKKGLSALGSIPARHFWDSQWWKEHWPEVAYPNSNGNPFVAMLDFGLRSVVPNPVLTYDKRPGAPPINAWWKGNTFECAWFIWAYESLWLPDTLLQDDAQQQRLADALFAASRHSGFELHFNKGLAGAPADAIARTKDTPTNPAVTTSFALLIAGDMQQPAYPGVAGHEPSVAEGRDAAKRVHQCVDQMRAVAGESGAYVSESNFFEKGFQRSYWGSNYPRLAQIKSKYDPEGLFFVHNGVGSEEWSADGFTKL
jgi:FAD/FMN-containing dehydrogenase